MEFLIVAAVIIGAIIILAKQGGKRREREQATGVQQRAEDMVTAACRFVAQANATRHFAEVSPGDVNIQPGEFALLREHATLFEQKSNRVSSGVGTRVHVGSMPFYLGTGSSSTYETTAAVATGELVLTNTRMIFMSNQRSAVLVLKDIVGMNASLDTITLHGTKRKSSFVFAVENPVLWSLLAKIGSSHPLESRFIPDGVTLKATPADAPGEVHFEALLAQSERLQ